MRGGRFQQRTTEDPNIRNAEILFEKRSITEIRDVESRTRKEIEEKKEELRQLVGASYRDLIESADSILAMRRSCENVAENINLMENEFNSLQKNIHISSTVNPVSDETLKVRELFFNMGSRVKYLMDTPEKIWGFLDENLYVDASQRFMRAKEVYALLMDMEKKKKEEKENNYSVLKSFPLLHHQWNLVESFHNQIHQRSKNRLQEKNLKINDYAIALSAISIIENLNSNQSFSLFLDSRKSWFLSILKSANFKADSEPLSQTNSFPEPSSPTNPLVHNVSVKLCDLITIIRSSLCHVGELFLEASTNHPPLLFSTLLSSYPESQLFGGIPDPHKETELWKRQKDELELNMTAVTSKDIMEKCQHWINNLTQIMNEQGSYLLESLTTNDELAKVEASVKLHLENHHLDDESIQWLKNAFGMIPDSLFDAICQLIIGHPIDIWQIFFEDIFVDKAKHIITASFHHLTIDFQIDQILSLNLNGQDYVDGKDGYGEHEEVKVRETEEEEEEGEEGEEGEEDYEDGFSIIIKESIGDLSWKTFIDDNNNINNNNNENYNNNVNNSINNKYNEDELYITKSSLYTSKLLELFSENDKKLLNILLDVFKVIQTDKQNERKKNISEFLQKTCFDCFNLMIIHIRNKVNVLKKNKKINHVIVEKALSIGRFCSYFYQNSNFLNIVFSLPSWGMMMSNEDSSSLYDDSNAKSNASEKKIFSKFESFKREFFVQTQKSGLKMREESGPNLQNLKFLQTEFRKLCIESHQIWVDFFSKKFSSSFIRHLEKDENLAMVSPPKAWEETIIKQEGEKEGEEIELRILLPSIPSCYVLHHLFSSSREIHRIGSHDVDRIVLRLLAWKLSQSLCDAYEKLAHNLLETKMHNISEKGILQIVFDIKFCSDVLSGGVEDFSNAFLQNESSEIVSENFLESFLKEEETRAEKKNFSSSSSAFFLPRKSIHPLLERSLKMRKEKTNSLLDLFCSQIDPIDWATYEEHLWRNEQRHYQRSSILLGNFVQLNRLTFDLPASKKSTASNTNVLDMPASIPRFSYLPISLPSSINQALSGMQKKLSSQKLSSSSSLSLSSPSPSPSSPFANGENSKSYFSTLPHASSFSSLGIKSIMGQVGSSALKIGSLVSDGQVGKNISTFGEMLPSQAAGLFNSFTLNAKN